MHNEIFRGRVKWFADERGFGFITRADGTDVFVHFRAIQAPTGGGYRTLDDGDRVEFEMATGRDGRPEAANVRKITADALR